jgi:uncharacterized protein DUF1638
MSNYPIEAISTTGSSISWPSPTDAAERAPVAIVACGALGPTLRDIVTRRDWNVEVHLLPALLHNRPRQIAPRVERLVGQLQARGHVVVLAYADCGTYGALDDVCERLGVARLRGQHCYDVFAGAERIEALCVEEPGTYLLTDFLVQSFRRTVLHELGLDRHPELWPDYFGHYRRVVWLAQRPSVELESEARRVAELFSLPLVVIEVGTLPLEVELEALLDNSVNVRRAEDLKRSAEHHA